MLGADDVEGVRLPRDEDEARVILLDTESAESERSAAARWLRSQNPIHPVFWQLLGDDNARVRVTAVDAVDLKAFREKAKVCPVQLIEALDDEDERVRGAAMNYIPVFERLPKEGLPLLLKALKHEDLTVRQNVAGAFYQFGKEAKRALPELKQALKDEDPLVRHNAAVSLWHITGQADLVVPTCVRHLTARIPVGDDPDAVWRASASLLRRIGLEATADTASVLIKLLADESPGMRRAAARSLGALAGENAKTRATIDRLNAEVAVRKLLEDPDEKVRQEARTALDRLAERE
jgi:HEAT repeat protein